MNEFIVELYSRGDSSLKSPNVKSLVTSYLKKKVGALRSAQNMILLKLRSAKISRLFLGLCLQKLFG